MPIPRISLCLIVRDEAGTLPRCLDSAAGAADELVVVDTGSVDGTPDVARARGARVVRRPWQHDFAAARNAALAEATGDWILYLDADEELEAGAAERIRALVAGDEADGYLCQVVNLTGSRAAPEREISLALRLFRNAPGHRFTGAVHERLLLPPGARVRDGGFRIHHWGYLDEALRDRAKLERNADLARRMVEADPDDALARFHLAVALHLQGRYAEAAEHCRHALALAPSPEEPWVGRLVRTHVSCLLAQRQPEEALAVLERWLPNFPRFTDLVYLQGVALMAQERLREALACFERCLEMGPAPVPPYASAQESLGGAMARYMVGVVRGRLGDLAGAATALRQALVDRPGWMAPLAALADLLGPTAAPALLDAGSAAGLSPRAVASALAADGRHAAALRCLDAAGDRGDPLLRATCLYHLGDYAAALRHARRVRGEGEGTARVLAARCLWVLHRDDEAAALLAGDGPEGYAAAAGAFLDQGARLLEAACDRFPDLNWCRPAVALLRGVTSDG